MDDLQVSLQQASRLIMGKMETIDESANKQKGGENIDEV